MRSPALPGTIGKRQRLCEIEYRRVYNWGTMPADRRRRRSAVFLPSGTLTEAKGRGISTEVELKLVASAADLPELKRALVEMTPVSGSSQSRLISTYYDTPDLALKHEGLVSASANKMAGLSKPSRRGTPAVVAIF